MVKVLPIPGSLSTSTCPPWAATMLNHRQAETRPSGTGSIGAGRAHELFEHPLLFMGLGPRRLRECQILEL
jgi:hypothetical protein